MHAMERWSDGGNLQPLCTHPRASPHRHRPTFPSPPPVPLPLSRFPSPLLSSALPLPLSLPPPVRISAQTLAHCKVSTGKGRTTVNPFTPLCTSFGFRCLEKRLWSRKGQFLKTSAGWVCFQNLLFAPICHYPPCAFGFCFNRRGRTSSQLGCPTRTSLMPASK